MRTKIFIFSWLFIIVVFNPLTGIALQTPELIGRVSDYAMFLDGEKIEAIDERLRQIEDSTDVQIAILILHNLPEGNSKTFANKVYKDWKIGFKGSDKGILILIIRETNDIYIKIGSGLSADISAKDIKWIINDEMAPGFRKKQFAEGIDKGLNAIEMLLTVGGIDDAVIDNSQNTVATHNYSSSGNWFSRVMYLFLWVTIVYFTLRGAYRKNGNGLIFFFIFFFLPATFAFSILATNEAIGFWMTVGFVLLFILAKLIRLTTVEAIWIKARKIKQDLWNLDKKWLREVNKPPQKSGQRSDNEYITDNEQYYGYLYRRKKQAPIWLISVKYLIIMLFYAAFGIFILATYLITGQATNHYQKSTYKTW